VLRDGYLQEINKNDEAKRRCATENARHDYYKRTRCTNVAEEEQSATPWGVKNVCADSDDEDAYTGEQAEIQAETDELRATLTLINPPGWDTSGDAVGLGADGERVDLREPMDAFGKKLSWADVKKSWPMQLKGLRR
jgi:hypothetical protein